MTTTLVAFLGTGNYKPVQYHYDGRTTAKPETYTQCALYELLSPPPKRVCLFVTAQAREQHLGTIEDGKLLAQLNAVMPDPAMLTAVDIPDGSSETELWEIFDILSKNISGNIIFDFTHGFRSLPVVATQAIQFLAAAGNICVDRLLYGAFDARNPRSSPPDNSVIPGAIAPFFDLTPMLDLPLWAQAAAEWRRTGRAQGLEEMLAGPVERLGRALQKKSPPELRTLPNKLGALSDALAVVKANAIPERAMAVLAILDAVKMQIEHHNVPELRPFALVINQLRDSISPLAPQTGTDIVGFEAANALVAQAKWYLERARYPEVATTAREAATEAFVQMALRLGIEHIIQGDKTKSSATSSFRSAIDGCFMRLARPTTTDTTGNDDMPAEPTDGNEETIGMTTSVIHAGLVRDFVLANPDLLEAINHVDRLRAQRNKPMHAYTGDHADENLARSGQPEKRVTLHGALDDGIQSVERLLAMVRSGCLRYLRQS